LEAVKAERMRDRGAVEVPKKKASAEGDESAGAPPRAF
jgi:hypothetical protein